jgi:prepilin signal peptidase PulO-like enzyme (type II secretory pathway)
MEGYCGFCRVSVDYSHGTALVLHSLGLWIDDSLFRFVTRPSIVPHLVVFPLVGLAAGFLISRWVRRFRRQFAVEFGAQSDPIPDAIILLGTALLFTALDFAVAFGGAHWVTEGGSIDWGHWRLLYHFVLASLLVAATVVDLEYYLIPDEITVPGLAIGVAGAALVTNLAVMHIWVDWNQADPIFGPYIPEWIKHHPHWHGLAWSIAGAAVGAGVTWLVRIVSAWVLRVESLGFGDVTLMAMIGGFLGWQPVVMVFFLAPLCGVVIGILLKIVHGRRALPYGPCLAASAMIVLMSWRWLWQPTREIFGHVPTLVGLAAFCTASLVGLLALLRLYRSIPVTRRKEEKSVREREE